MKKFFKEFKEFITRGNVLDMAVGIIVGSAFTAIITALVANILTPLINWIPGADNTRALQVVLRKAVLDEAGHVLTEALVIDFGAVISAVLTFLITAFVLFIILKTINSIRKKGEKLREQLKKKEEEEIKDVAAESPAPVTQIETTDDILREIRDLLKANAKSSEEKAE